MKKLRPVLALTLLTALGASAGGCSSSDPGEQSSPVGSGGAGGQPNDSECDAPPFAANMKGETEDHRSITLVSSRPAPPIEGDNDWVVAVADAEGQPLPGLPVKISRYMPRHKHGGVGTIAIEDNGDGTYAASPVNFNMTGKWEVTVRLGEDATAPNVKFSFCVE